MYAQKPVHIELTKKNVLTNNTKTQKYETRKRKWLKIYAINSHDEAMLRKRKWFKINAVWAFQVRGKLN